VTLCRLIKNKTEEKNIVDVIDYQMSVTQLRGVRGRWRYAKRLFPRLHI